MSKRHKEQEIPIHKHCYVCEKPILYNSDKNTCSKECEEKYNKQQSSRGRMQKIQAFVPLGMLILLFVITFIIPKFFTG